MKIILKPYQQKAVDNLYAKTSGFIAYDDNSRRTAVLQAPTGSGKTAMVASLIYELVNTENQKDIAFLWMTIGTGDLHIQSKNALEGYFQGAPKIQSIDEIYGTSQYELLKNSVLVINWEKIRNKDKSGEWKNIVMKDGDYTNFREILDNTNRAKRKIILIIDESHSNTRTDRALEMIKLINPSVVLEVSATPTLTSAESDEYVREKVNPQDVIEQQMIKDEIIVNDNFDTKQSKESDSVLLRTAIQKREQLAKIYKENSIDVNPLMVIQLPNADKGEVKRKFILDFLASEYDIGIDDERLALWFDKENKNTEGIRKNTAKQNFLLFKTAIATGWDCPRAQILLKFREQGEETFEIQTLGRILRMPEQKHYEIETLNKAYVYTNITGAQFEIEEYNPNILGDAPALLQKIYKPIKITSFFKERADYQDVKADFKTVLQKQFIKECKLVDNQKENIKILEKLGGSFDFKHIPVSLLKDIHIDSSKIDVKDYTIGGETDKSLILSESDIELAFRSLLRSYMGPFTNIKRSVPQMTTAWYVFVRECLGEKVWNDDVLASQKFLLINKDLIGSVFMRAVEAYAVVREKKAEEDTKHIIANFEISDKYYFNKETDEEVNYSKSILQPCWLNKNRLKPEKEFEKYINKQDNTIWWWKNGENRRDFFGIKYIDDKGKTHTFYPDYLVQFKNGQIGIIETKDADDRDGTTWTKWKAEALQKYIVIENKKGKNLFGGIVAYDNQEWQIQKESKFDLGSGWVSLKI